MRRVAHIRPMMGDCITSHGIRNWCYVCLRVPPEGFDSQVIHCQRNGHPKEGCMKYPPTGTLAVWNEQELEDVRKA
jgi:hypothetical protein